MCYIEIKRVFNRKMFYFSIILGAIIMNRPLIEMMIENSIGVRSISEILSTPLATSDFTPFAAIFCVLPFADSFCEDYNSGFVKYIVKRSGARKYSLSKCIATALSGGMVMFLIFLITIIYCRMLSQTADTEENLQFMRNTIWYRSGLLFYKNGLLYLSLRLLFAFLFGCVWSLVGLLVSSIISNRYVTYIAPFVIYQMMWFFLNEKKWNPVYMLRGDYNLIPSVSFVILYQVGLILILFFLSISQIEKKVKL